MGADNVLLFILVWTFTAVCRSDDDVCSLSCKNVTGTVGEEVTLTCSVSLKCSECCITMYKFQYPEIYKDRKEICRQDHPQDSCDQRNSFTCRYTPTTTVPEKFRFFVQTKCGIQRTEFTVKKTGSIKPKTITEGPREKGSINSETDTEGCGHGSPFNGAAVGCFIIIIIIIFIIGMSVYCVKRFKRSNPSGLQMKYERGASEEPTMTTVNDQNETK